MNNPSYYQVALPKVAQQSVCPSCGVYNNCAIESGKSASSCWCFGLDRTYANTIIENDVENKSCYCRSCLKKKNKES